MSDDTYRQYAPHSDMSVAHAEARGLPYRDPRIVLLQDDLAAVKRQVSLLEARPVVTRLQIWEVALGAAFAFRVLEILITGVLT